MKSILNHTRPLLRLFHSSAKRLEPRPTNEYGEALFTVKEFMAEHARGFAEAKAELEGRESKIQEINPITEEDIKKAGKQGRDLANQHIGGKIRGVWDLGFMEGLKEGLEEKPTEVELQNRKALIEEADKTSYSQGVAAHPDCIAAKEEGRKEGEKEGYKIVEAEGVIKIDQALDHRKRKTNIAIDNAITTYSHSRQFSTRFIKPVKAVYNFVHETFENHRLKAKYTFYSLLAIAYLMLLKKAYDKNHDQYLHGATDKEHLEQMEVRRRCDQLTHFNPAFFHTLSFIFAEELELKKCQKGCADFKLSLEAMRSEMEDRRASGHKDGRFFSEPTPTAEFNCLKLAIPTLENEIAKRVKHEKEQEKQRRNQNKYREILSSELVDTPSNGPGTR